MPSFPAPRALALAVLVAAFAAPAPSALAAPGPVPAARLAATTAKVLTFRAPPVAGTPRRYDRVQVRRYGPANASTVLVLVPGTLGGAADFHVVAPALVQRIRGLQVWAQMRREGALHDTRTLERARAGEVTVQQAFDYYLGWLAKPVTPHYRPLDPADYAFVGDWGLRVAMDDLHTVVQAARAGGRKQPPRRVILGGHSLGGSVAGMYAAWDFDGRAGVEDLAGIVAIDGGAGGIRAGATTTAKEARAQLDRLAADGPFTDLLGLRLPWIAGAFGELSALAAHVDPTAPSVGQSFLLLPPVFRAPVSVTNRAQLGYAFDAKTSPPGLSLIQVRSGALAAAGDPRDWVDDPAQPTPIANLADAFSLEPLGAIEWYYPARLSIDVGAGSSLRATAAARTLGLRIRHVRDVDVPLYAFGAALAGRDGALKTASQRYKRLSRIPSVTYVDRSATYSHLDPLLAAPERSAFVATVVPWLKRAMRRPVR
ncbi:MAG TPA: hypothetical protein VLK58_26835 [Conexibacter sp.]|nr:hypothetical protein [Conexibacter sp.]